MRRSLTLLLLLSACGTVQNATDIGIAYPPPSKPGVVDAVYFGTPDTTKKTDHAKCPNERPGTLEIGDRRVSFAYLPNVMFNPPVQADGTFHDEVGPATLKGRFKDDRLRMVVDTPQCHTEYDMKTIGNRS